MINKPAEDAYRTATYIAKLYAKLDVARDIINHALDETPSNFDQAQFDRIMDIRDKLNREIGLIFDLSKREAHRICNTQLAPAPQLIWKDDITPDQPGLWAFMNHDGDIFYHDASKTEKPLSWEKGRWCFLGPTPEIILNPNLSPAPPQHSPAEDQDRNFSGSHDELSLPVMDLNIQLSPPDPTYIQVDNPGIETMISEMLKEAYHKPQPNETRITNRILPGSGIAGV